MLVINNIRLNTFYTCAFVYLVTQASVLKRAFEMCIIKIVQSLDSSVSRVTQTSIRFPNRKLERSETNISRHIYIIQNVIAVEFTKRKFQHEMAESLGAFLCNKCTLRGTVGNIVTYH